MVLDNFIKVFAVFMYEYDYILVLCKQCKRDFDEDFDFCYDSKYCDITL